MWCQVIRSDYRKKLLAFGQVIHVLWLPIFTSQDASIILIKCHVWVVYFNWIFYQLNKNQLLTLSLRNKYSVFLITLAKRIKNFEKKNKR